MSTEPHGGDMPLEPKVATEPAQPEEAVIDFADVVSGEFDIEAIREDATPAKRVLLPQPESPKLH